MTYGWQGPQIRLKSSDGGVLLRDIGRFAVTDTIDLHDPNDPDDDELVDSVIITAAGQRLDESVDFCAVAVAALVG